MFCQRRVPSATCRALPPAVHRGRGVLAYFRDFQCAMDILVGYKM